MSSTETLQELVNGLGCVCHEDSSPEHRLLEEIGQWAAWPPPLFQRRPILWPPPPPTSSPTLSFRPSPEPATVPPIPISQKHCTANASRSRPRDCTTSDPNLTDEPKTQKL